MIRGANGTCKLSCRSLALRLLEETLALVGSCLLADSYSTVQPARNPTSMQCSSMHFEWGDNQAVIPRQKRRVESLKGPPTFPSVAFRGRPSRRGVNSTIIARMRAIWQAAWLTCVLASPVHSSMLTGSVAAVYDLLDRIIPGSAVHFYLSFLPSTACPLGPSGTACFNISDAAGGHTAIAGTSASELSAGVGAYLREFCGMTTASCYDIQYAVSA